MVQDAAVFPLLSTGKVPLADLPCAGRVPQMTDMFYNRIRERLDALGMSDREASMKVSGTPDLIRNIKRGKSESLRGPRLLKLAALLGVSANWLQSGERDHIPSEEVAAGLSGETHRENNGASAAAPFKGEVPGSIPEIDARAGAGVGSVGEYEIVKVREGESIVGHKVISEWLFPSPYLRHELRANPGKTVVLEVIGDSMSPTLESGDRVLVDTSYQRPNPDGIYVIDDGDGPMVKRVQLVRPSNPEQIRIISDNKNQEPYSRLLSDIRIVGRVAGRLTSM